MVVRAKERKEKKKKEREREAALAGAGGEGGEEKLARRSCTAIGCRGGEAKGNKDRDRHRVVSCRLDARGFVSLRMWARSLAKGKVGREKRSLCINYISAAEGKIKHKSLV